MEQIKEANVLEQYSSSMGVYGIEVTLRRMVPDWRDGLKLVQRRILLSMLSKGCDKKFAKTSKIVGDTMGNYHPHGDSSIADAIKCMTNWFECYVPLIDNHSNFGSMQGDGAAAPRYTEIKLSDYTMDCLLDEMIKQKQVVDWVPTYNNEMMEPESLPCKVPNLLINGTFGIALGFTSWIPKHNVSEVIDATINLIRHPNASVVLVPDQCMPCEIVEANWKAISNKGRGSFKVRSIIDIEREGSNVQLVIRSTPDSVYFDKGIKGGVKTRIVEMVKESKLPQITGIVEESQGCNMRIVIKLKKGSDPNYVKEVLYKTTELEKTVTVNFIVLNGINLIHMSYKMYLQFFIEQRKDTKFRLYTNRLQNLRTKYHEMENYIKVLESGYIDEIIKRIRTSKQDDAELIEYLVKLLNITDIQAKFIINTSIKKLSEKYLQKYKEEYKYLKEQADICIQKILHEELLEEEIIQELQEYKRKYGRPRNCRVIAKSEANNIPSGEFRIVITENNYIRKINITNTVPSVKGDNPKFIIDVDNAENIILFSEKGRAFKLPVYKIPITDKQQPGIDIRVLVKGLLSNVVEVFYEPLLRELSKTLDQQFFIAVLTRNNYIKKMDLNDFLNVAQSGLIYTKLNDNDSVCAVRLVSNLYDVIVYTKKKALRFAVDEIPHYKRATFGSLAMSTKETLDGFSITTNNSNDQSFILIVTKNGRVNKIVNEALTKSKRNKAGSNVIRLSKGDEILNIFSIESNRKNTLIIKTQSGITEIPVDDILVQSSISIGTKVISTRGDVILSCKVE